MGLTGTFAELPLAELIEMTSLGSKTGRLQVAAEDQSVTGELVFRRGRLVGASCGEFTAERAFYALIALKAGTFDFDTKAEIPEDVCNLGTESLLMEGMRRLDEINRLRRDMPAPSVVRYIEGEAESPTEARVLGYLGPGARKVGDIIEGVLVGGENDEYDALKAIQRLTERGVTRLETPPGTGTVTLQDDGPPQPKLER